jgi:hypothetical protein
MHLPFTEISICRKCHNFANKKILRVSNFARLEFIPFGAHNNGVRVPARLVDIFRMQLHLLFDLIEWQIELRVAQLEPELLLLHFRIVDAQKGALVEQKLANVNGGGLARVARVLLEREAKHGDALAVERVEEPRRDEIGEAFLLVVVDANHLVPVLGHLLEVQTLAQVDQVVDVLLEAAAAEAHARLEELVADARVGSDRARHLLNVRSARLAYRRDRVYAGDLLCEHGIGGQLRQLGGPRVGCDYAILANLK